MPGGIHPPLSVIASWPSPNYEHPATRRTTLVPVCAVLAALSVATVSLRLLSRLHISRNAGIDDWVMVVAMLPTIGLTISMCLAEQLYGFNRHVWDVPLDTLVNARKVIFAIDLQYLWGTGLIKISILLFYNRLATGILGKNFIYFVRILIATVIAYMVGFTLSLFISTRPLNAFWNQINPTWEANHQYTNAPEARLLLLAAAISIVHDFLVAGTPTVLFFRLQIPLKQKVALGAIFVIGYFLCISGIMRLIFIRQAWYTSYDVTWITQPVLVWTAVETLTGTIVASAPALKVVVRHYFYVFAYTYGSDAPSHTYTVSRNRNRDSSMSQGRLDVTGSDNNTSKRNSALNRFSLPSVLKGQPSNAAEPIAPPALIPPWSADVLSRVPSSSPKGAAHAHNFVLDDDAPTPPGYVHVDPGSHVNESHYFFNEKDDTTASAGTVQQKPGHTRSSASSLRQLIRATSTQDMEMGVMTAEHSASTSFTEPGVAF